MGFSWFRAESDAADHPKVMELATALNVPLAHADGLVFRLWCWTQRYAPSGAFSARAVPHLEVYLGAVGVIKIMRDLRLIDDVSDGFCVHDWADMQGAIVEKSKRDARIKRLKRRLHGAKTARAGRVNGAQTAPLQDRTGQDTTGQDRTGEKQDEISPSAMPPTGPATDTPRQLLEAWNARRDPALPAAVELSKARRASAKERLLERPLPEWLQVIDRISASAFCRGANDRAWVATFDWLLRPDTAAKVLEGKYDNRTPIKPVEQSTKYASGSVKL